jgi:hypothetical protein
MANNRRYSGATPQISKDWKELLEKVQPEIAWCDSQKKLANFLGRFDLVARQDSTGKVRGYHVKKEWLEDVRNRYLGSLPSFEVSEPSESRSGGGFPRVRYFWLKGVSEPEQQTKRWSATREVAYDPRGIVDKRMSEPTKP